MRTDRIFSFHAVSPRFITKYTPFETVVFKPIKIKVRKSPYMEEDKHNANKKQKLY